jgi:branched-chain amino acid transport system permease protein
MEAIILQILNGLDKGSAYALIALGLTLIFGTLGVVNFAHGALFMIGAFCAVTLSRILSLSHVVTMTRRAKDFLGNPLKIEVPYVHELVRPGSRRHDHRLVSALVDPVCHSGDDPDRRDHGARPDQALLQAPPCRPDPGDLRSRHRAAGRSSSTSTEQTPFRHRRRRRLPAPSTLAPHRVRCEQIIYPYWRLVYFAFAHGSFAAVFSFLQFTTFGMVVRAGMADRETVGLLGINIDKRFTIMFGIAAAVAGLAGVMYTPINSPNYHMGMDFLVLLRGGCCRRHGQPAGGAVAQASCWASWRACVDGLGHRPGPGINQIIIYLVAIVILLTRPRG